MVHLWLARERYTNMVYGTVFTSYISLPQKYVICFVGDIKA